MTIHNISKIALVLTSLSFVSVGGTLSHTPAAEAKSSTQVTSQTQIGTEQAIRSRLAELTKALRDGDAKTEASLWTDNGVFVDDNGKEWEGRTQLEQRFSSIFAEDGKQLVDLVPHKIRMLSNNVALAQGVVHDKQTDNEATPDTYFSIMFLKQNGQWLISMATETPLAAQMSSEPLKALDWLIGEWAVERNGKSIHIKYQWTADKHFIHARYGINDANESDKDEVQIIGWDPRTRQIMSWDFDANGGFGHSVWFKKDNQWLIDKTSIGGDGSTSRSMQILSMSSPDSYSWQSVSRTTDGVAAPDTVKVIVQRLVK